LTMYSKGGGKAGAHAWVPTCESIGSLSYIAVQTYQHSYHRQFKITHHHNAALGTMQFAHLPSNSFLVRLPTGADTVKMFRDHVEIKVGAHKIFDELMMEKEVLAQAVASLNTVRCKGKANFNLLEVAEDDGVAE
ncbi:hypothetical protein B0H10DRAFT_1792426, partial [Mycena sp. CBHHK59/15]